MKKRILGYTWFTCSASIGTIGIIVCADSVGDLRAYIGAGSLVPKSPLEDAKTIQITGAKFPLVEAFELINKIGAWIEKPNVIDIANSPHK